MNMLFCDGVMPPEMIWETRDYYAGNWKYWLQFMVEKEHDVIMQIPKFPHAHALYMQYDEWEKIMDFQDINPNTTIVAHSAGGGFVLKYMALHPDIHVKQIILVAPWIDPGYVQPNGFYDDFELTDNITKQTSDGIDMLISDDDMSDILKSAEKIASDIPDIRIHKFSGRGHFCTPELPEILSMIKYN